MIQGVKVYGYGIVDCYDEPMLRIFWLGKYADEEAARLNTDPEYKASAPYKVVQLLYKDETK